MKKTLTSTAKFFCLSLFVVVVLLIEAVESRSQVPVQHKVTLEGDISQTFTVSLNNTPQFRITIVPTDFTYRRLGNISEPATRGLFCIAIKAEDVVANKQLTTRTYCPEVKEIKTANTAELNIYRAALLGIDNGPQLGWTSKTIDYIEKFTPPNGEQELQYTALTLKINKIRLNFNDVKDGNGAFQLTGGRIKFKAIFFTSK